ncbi:MAG: hypothetical protein GY694_04830 [Gammaproteobacteria bacterium]|nr:hypothetical protein [Gammaproteobacteria bacterium]
MKTLTATLLKTLVTASLFASVTLAATAQADDALSNLIYEESSNIYSEISLKASEQIGVLSFGDNANKNSVWSSEFEEYVNSADYKSTDIVSIDDVNQLMENNPTAAGRAKGREVFVYNTTAGEYHLQ